MSAGETAPAVGCDACRRPITAIKRRYRGQRYCATCYQREFKRRPCPGCGAQVRLPVDDRTATCRACERKRPCVHCARVDERRGKDTPDGRVCGRCAQRLRAPAPCEACGEPSRQLARVARLGHDLRVCPRCARAGHATCEACRRHRPLEIAPDGRRLCRRCRAHGEVPCPECGRAMPAGYGKRCERCDWTERALRRIHADRSAFDSSRMAERFADFGSWLIETAGPHAAALKLRRYRALFTTVEREWGDVPDYGTLLGRFGAEGLRRWRVPVRWMAARGLVTVDAEEREADSERRRITEALARLPRGSAAHAVLDGYYRTLLARSNQDDLSLHGLRLALSPAVRLLEASHAAGEGCPGQRTLDALLAHSPGQHAALTGFVRYLQSRHDADLAMPPPKPGTAAYRRREQARQRLMALMDEDGTAADYETRWRTAALAFFHDLPMRTGDRVAEKDVRPDRGGWCVDIKGQDHWIPLAPAHAQGATRDSSTRTPSRTA